MSELERFPDEPYPRGGPGCNWIAVHPRGHLMLTGTGGDPQVRTVVDGRPLRSMSVRKPTSLSLSHDGALLLVGGKDNAVKLFDVETGALVGQNDGFTDWVEEVGWLPDGQHFAAVSRKGQLIVGHRRGAATVSMIQILEPDTHVDGLAVLPGSGAVVLSSGAKLLCVDLADGKRQWEVDFGWASAKRVSIAPRGDRGVVHVVTKTDEVLQLFSVAAGALGPRYPFKTPSGITWPAMGDAFIRFWPASAFSPDGQVIAATTPVGTLVLVDANTGAPLWEATRAPGMGWITDLAWLADGNHLILGCSDNAINVWRMRPLHWVLSVPVQAP